MRTRRGFAMLALCGAMLVDADAQPSQALSIGAEIVARIEAQLQQRGLPDGAYPIKTYLRFYALRDVEGRAVIEARYLRRTPDRRLPESATAVAGNPGSFVVTDKELPFIVDGGCSQLTLYFDVARGQLARVREDGMPENVHHWALCNGHA